MFVSKIPDESEDPANQTFKYVSDRFLYLPLEVVAKIIKSLHVADIVNLSYASHFISLILANNIITNIPCPIIQIKDLSKIPHRLRQFVKEPISDFDVMFTVFKIFTDKVSSISVNLPTGIELLTEKTCPVKSLT